MSDKYQRCIDTITSEYTAGDFFREVYEAKKEFFENLGALSEEDQDFENQMDLFMGWYLFDRPLNHHELPPALLFYRKHADSVPPEEAALYKSLTEIRHSIYEILKQKGISLTLKDLSTGEKYEVDDLKFRVGFSKGDIFEARLIPDGKKFVFANGFCFHPKEAYKFIETQMKKIRDEDRAQRTKLLLKLTQMKNKQRRFPHIDINFIYTLTPKF